MTSKQQAEGSAFSRMGYDMIVKPSVSSWSLKPEVRVAQREVHNPKSLSILGSIPRPP